MTAINLYINKSMTAINPWVYELLMNWFMHSLKLLVQLNSRSIVSVNFILKLYSFNLQEILPEIIKKWFKETCSSIKGLAAGVSDTIVLPSGFK